jgi:hypothetical protein
MTLVALGFMMMVFASDIASLAFVTPFFDSKAAFDLIKLGSAAVGTLLVVATAAYLLRNFFEIENYLDHASRLLKEYYLAVPHPRLLAGADRLSRELILLHGPKEALGMLSNELAKLVESSQPKQPPVGSGFAYPANPSSRPERPGVQGVAAASSPMLPG